MMEGYVTAKLLFNAALISIAATLTAMGVDINVFSALGWLLFFDYVTGIMKARALGHNITSMRMKYGMISKFSILFIPIALATAATGVDADAKTVLSVGMNILILSELYSVISNVHSIRTREELPEMDAVSLLGRKIRSLLIKDEENNDVQ